MPYRLIERIRRKILLRDYDLTIHAIEEMAEDDLDIRHIKHACSNPKNGHYGYQCEHCEGTVRAKKIDREAFKHRKGFIILEGITVGVCDACGFRYYSAEYFTPSTNRHRRKTLRTPRRYFSPSRVITIL